VPGKPLPKLTWDQAISDFSSYFLFISCTFNLVWNTIYICKRLFMTIKSVVIPVTYLGKVEVDGCSLQLISIVVISICLTHHFWPWTTLLTLLIVPTAAVMLPVIFCTLRASFVPSVLIVIIWWLPAATPETWSRRMRQAWSLWLFARVGDRRGLRSRMWTILEGRWH